MAEVFAFLTMTSENPVAGSMEHSGKINILIWSCFACLLSTNYIIVSHLHTLLHAEHCSTYLDFTL